MFLGLTQRQTASYMQSKAQDSGTPIRFIFPYTYVLVLGYVEMGAKALSLQEYFGDSLILGYISWVFFRKYLQVSECQGVSGTVWEI